MKQLGIGLLAIGFVITLITGFNFVTKEKVVDIGTIEITADKNHGFAWSPLVGLVVMAAGGIAYLSGTKKS